MSAEFTISDLSFHPNMRSSAFSLLCLLFFTFLHATFAADPLYSICSNSNNYTNQGQFDKNLNLLLASLSTKVPFIGFGLGSVGETPDQVNGLALCRGDVSSAKCKTCINDAVSDIHQLCQYKKEAIVWYDYCLLHYSSDAFVGKIDRKNKFYMWNVASVDDPKSFNQKTRELLLRLALESYHTPLMFATGDMDLGGSDKLYGLVQCTRDLSIIDCKKCIESAISELPKCCDGKRGGRVIGGSCNFRYELYPFVDKN